MKRITTRAELADLAVELGVMPDWHEPGEVNVKAAVFGESFDNAGFWGDDRAIGEPHEEMHVIIKQDGKPVGAVNLATLFAWATGYQD